MVVISNILDILTTCYPHCKSKLREVVFIIDFNPLWETMRRKNISTYALREKHNISSETIHRLKHNKAITTTKLDDLCNILDCDVQDIIKHIKEE